MHLSRSFSLVVTFCFCSTTNAAYNLVKNYNSSNFFSEFAFFTSGDPTLGYVNYVSQAAAQGANQPLINTNNNQVYLGVDHTTNQPAGGRQSVRLSSYASFTQGLFIADIAHMPVGCGTWPAFWMFGPNWPSSGEIDIIEGVNNQQSNSLSLHTSPGCSVGNWNSQPGTNTLSTNCNQDNGNTGCGVSTWNTNSFGSGFNSIGGGVYATQWAGSGIYIWFFQRGSIPADITKGAPNTAAWGQPFASFQSGNGGCDFGASFMNHNLVFDTTFCGTWAGSVWSQGSCSTQAWTCQDYVAGNPSAFVNAYWLINSVKVYQ